MSDAHVNTTAIQTPRLRLAIACPVGSDQLGADAGAAFNMAVDALAERCLR
jgi:hypothetical protein